MGKIEKIEKLKNGEEEKNHRPPEDEILLGVDPLCPEKLGKTCNFHFF